MSCMAIYMVMHAFYSEGMKLIYIQLFFRFFNIGYPEFVASLDPDLMTKGG